MCGITMCLYLSFASVGSRVVQMILVITAAVVVIITECFVKFIRAFYVFVAKL